MLAITLLFSTSEDNGVIGRQIYHVIDTPDLELEGPWFGQLMSLSAKLIYTSDRKMSRYGNAVEIILSRHLDFLFIISSHYKVKV